MDRSHGQRIGYLDRMGQRYFSEKLGALGIGPGQIFILKYLYHNDGINQEVLVDNCQVHKANVARALFKLEESGLVERVVDLNDKRAKLLYVTDKAKNIEDEFMSIFKSWTDMLTRGFSEEEKKLSYKFLSRMAENVEPYYGDEKKL